MATNKLTRRQFIQALAAGMAVASMPAIIPLDKRTDIATKAMGAPRWRFIVAGGSGGMGDRLILLPPGVAFNPSDDWPGRTFIHPEPFPLYKIEGQEFNRPITLMPWRSYQKQIENLFPEVVARKYKRLLSGMA
jgi:hypothetical protein